MITTVRADGCAERRLITELKQRAESTNKDVTQVVSDIIENVKNNGDKAVREYTIKFDGSAP